MDLISFRILWHRISNIVLRSKSLNRYRHTKMLWLLKFFHEIGFTDIGHVAALPFGRTLNIQHDKIIAIRH